MLNTDLIQIREAAQQIQREEQQKRISNVALNSYAVGDLILFDEASKGFRDQKLKFRYAGPYMVTSVYRVPLINPSGGPLTRATVNSVVTHFLVQNVDILLKYVDCMENDSRIV